MTKNLPPDFPWTTKIDAFLHDPAHKALVLGSGVAHEKTAKLISGQEPPPKDSPIRGADQIAAAADRNAYLGDSEAYWQKVQPLLTHPLGGEQMKLPGHFQGLAKKEIVERFSERVQPLILPRLLKSRGQETFLWIWRFYFEDSARVISQDESAKDFREELRKYFPFFPADTRQPDHTLWQHLSVTAALSAALQPGYKPAFLIFGIGPVQEVISAARRTADLWAGSWLLSFLTWKAIEVIIEQAGPDSIIFPSLRGQPLFELWLSKKLPDYRIDEALRKNLRIASFPNRFVAILPYLENGNALLHAPNLVREAEEKVKESWDKLADTVKEHLTKEFSRNVGSLWDTQVKSFPEIYWIVLPWPGSSINEGYHKTKEAWKTLCSSAEMITPLPESLSFTPNWGNAYAELYTLADRFYGSRKNLRPISIPNEVQEGEVSSLNPALLALPGDRPSAKEWWSELESQLKGKNIYLLQPEGRERLDALSAIKRFLPILIGEKSSEVLPSELEPISFPSNSEIAAAPFKKKILEELPENKNAKVGKAAKNFLSLLSNLLSDRVFYRERIALPAFQSHEREEFARLEGSWLYEAHWEKGYLQREGIAFSEEERVKIQEALRQLYASLQATPSPYYAVLAMDGDHMGRWLNGTHEKMPLLSEVVHPRVIEKLQKKGLEQKTRRPVTPAYHAFISEALGYFARMFVPQIVESMEHLGVVVYAGGDDVLAFLPAQTAIAAALKLRAAFGGFVRKEGDQWKEDWRNKTGYVDTLDQLIPTMGPRATASVGIAFAHHRMPLQVALEEARAALKA
ncbi:MAG: type III-B CRISPR-associated protein Cas10/Cmr2, partial [Bacteroidia bacterium]|nr:type III-B CRISPR-associated protein Cas10/Cmr2 [Bacteroidia bacterium]